MPLRIFQPGANCYYYGRHAVSALLSLRPQDCHELLLQEHTHESTSDILSLAQTHPHIVTRFQPKSILNNLVQNRPHQGLVLQAHPPHIPLLTSLLPLPPTPSRPQLVVVLDQIQDPENLGSILRSSYFFGVAAVVISLKNSVGLTPVAAKASAGTSEALVAEQRLFGSHNLPATLQMHRDAGWRVLGTDVAKGSLDRIPPHPQSLVVFGNEGQGLRTTVKQACEGFVQLAMAPRPALPAGGHPALFPNPSLNVNAACAALLAQWSQRQ